MPHALHCRVCRALRLGIAQRLIDAMFVTIVNANYDADEFLRLVMAAAVMDSEQ